jgi:SAM-dependent methyltransferase
MAGTIKTEYKQYLDGEDGADTYNAFKKILYGEPDSLVPQVFQALSPGLGPARGLSILDVGGGDGKRAIALAGLLQARGMRARITVVEPSEAFTSDLKRKGTAGIEVVRSSFEEFATTERFDLVIFLHSIFTFEDDLYLRKAKELLKPGGSMCIVANAPDSFLAQLKAIVDEGRGLRKEIDSVFKDLEGNGWRYKTTDVRTRFGGCVQERRLTEKGLLVLEWIALRPVSALSEAVRAKAEECFMRNAEDGVITEREMIVIAR